MVEGLKEIDLCPQITFTAPDIPTDILKQLQEDDYISLRETYGDPSWGEPIQYDCLRIRTRSGTKTIQIFNRGILLFIQNTEETRRAHRITYAVEKYMRDVGRSD
jgi:hypothetical protein